MRSDLHLRPDMPREEVVARRRLDGSLKASNDTALRLLKLPIPYSSLATVEAGTRHQHGVATSAGDLRENASIGKMATVAGLIEEAGRSLWIDACGAQTCMERAIALLADAGIAIVAGISCVGPSQSQLAPWQVSRTLRFVDDNLTQRITVRQLANVSGLSASYFARAFRTTIGECPRTFIALRRLSRARDLLLTTDMPLAIVALECGWSDQARLSKEFRRFVGVSPGAWRKMHREESYDAAASGIG